MDKVTQILIEKGYTGPEIEKAKIGQWVRDKIGRFASHQGRVTGIVASRISGLVRGTSRRSGGSGVRSVSDAVSHLGGNAKVVSTIRRGNKQRTTIKLSGKGSSERFNSLYDRLDLDLVRSTRSGRNYTEHFRDRERGWLVSYNHGDGTLVLNT